MNSLSFQKTQKFDSNLVVIDMLLHCMGAAMFDVISIINCNFFTRKKKSHFLRRNILTTMYIFNTVEVQVKFNLNRTGMFITI